MGHWDPASMTQKQEQKQPDDFDGFSPGFCHLWAPTLFTKLSLCFTAVWKLPYLPRMEVWNVLAITVPCQHRPCREWRESCSVWLEQQVRAPVTLWKSTFLRVYHWPFHPLAGATPCGSKVVHLHLSLFISLYSTFDNICKNYMESSFGTLKLAANQEPMCWSSSTIRKGEWVAEVRGAEPWRVFRWGTIWWESQASLLMSFSKPLHLSVPRSLYRKKK